MILLLVFAPLAIGLLCLLFQRGLRSVPLIGYGISLAVALYILLTGRVLQLHLMDRFGIALLLDQAAAWFVLLNAVVSMAVAWHERYRGRHHYFFILLTLLHGCVNACFLSQDLFNLYVVIELTTIAAFLLLGQGMTTRHLWNALRYVFLSNVGMLFYLLGTLLVYASAGDFAFSSVPEAPPTARALIMAGLLTKGGVFLCGLWLPQAHAEADAAVSALLSGVVVNIGLVPLLRMEAGSADMARLLQGTGWGSIFMGLGLAFFQRDIKRLLACSTLSQVGFILIVPLAGPLYAFSHGVAKCALFLGAGNLRERDLTRLRKQGGERPVLLPMKAAALSMAGCPLMLGYAAKEQVGQLLTGGASWAAGLASVGTAAILAPILMMPSRKTAWRTSPFWQAPAFLISVLLLFGLVLGFPGLWKGFKAILILLAGLALHRGLAAGWIEQPLPDGWEKLEHVIGLTSVVLLLLILGVYLP